MTRRAVNIIFAAVLLSVIGLTLGSALLLRAGICLLAMFALALIGILMAKYSLRLRYSVKSDTVNRGDTLSIDVRLSFSSFFPLGALAVKLESGETLRFDGIPFKEKRTVVYRKLNHTGIYTQSGADVLLTDMYNLFILKRTFKKADSSVLVLPVSGYAEKPKVQSRSIDGKIKVRSDDSNELSDIREWIDGDLIRRIHWKLTAKNFASAKEKPIVKTYEEAARPYTIILTDLNAIDAAAETVLCLKDGVRESALSVVEAVVNSGDRAKLLLCGSVTEEKDYTTDCANCAECLALAQFDGYTEIRELINEISIRRDIAGAAVVVTTRLNASMADIMLRLMNGVMMSISVIYVTDTITADISGLISGLEANGISVKTVAAINSEEDND